MSLRSGTKLGPYEIQSPIGAGGMGEVYRARDSRLNRDVAIKVLPASFSADQERLQRFALECRATAALNHPNILSIFDIGEDHAAPYVVSELLEGETLRDRLREGPLTSRKAIDYARQIANGLAAAHEKGITHRDLKPENLFITNDGRVKILDFGLAKLTHPEADQSGDAPTQQIATDAGTVMGTVGYMAPEQVRGKPADPRSDIFAFGAILYEMLSGKRAFHGDSPVDTMSAILKEDPPDLTETNRTISSALERIVRHCLEKNPAERFQSARDLAFNLEALTDVSTSSRGSIQALPLEEEKKKSRWLIPVLAAVLVLASWAAIYFLARRGAVSNPTFHEITFRNGTIWDARFAPDGQSIIYGAAWEGKPPELFSTRFDSTDSRPLSLGPAQILAISSKGEMAISLGAATYSAFTQTGTLARVPLAGGAPREVLDQVMWADWAPDGESFAVIRISGPNHNHLEFPIGNEIYTPQAWVSHVRFSPDGQFLAIADHIPSGDDGRIVIIDRHGNRKASSSFYSSVQGLAWSPSGKEVWFTAVPGGAARSLYALDFSGKERLIYRAPGGVTIHDISRNWLVLLTADKSRIGLFALAPGETKERSLSWFDWSLLNDISADGKTILFSESGEATGDNDSVFIRSTDGAPAVRLGSGDFGKLSPDGKWAIIETGKPAKLMLVPTRVGEPRQLTDDKVRHFNSGWLPDGKTIFFSTFRQGQPQRSYLLDIDSPGAAPRPITPEDTVAFLATPDGKFLLAYDANRQRWLYPVAGGEPQKMDVTTGPGEVILDFFDSGKSVLVRNRSVPIKITRIDLATGKRTPFREIAPADPAGVQSIPTLRFSADGKSYAYSLGRQLSDLYVVDGLK
ncbi:MAG TPA: protein kinase [Candidatus Aquilonibacter sp.]|jgi:serine/threonine protein kinase/Tol biopolymer transport system component|nr:protein kinase [Candidatus Aquilonibacter sp.]